MDLKFLCSKVAVIIYWSIFIDRLSNLHDTSQTIWVGYLYINRDTK